MNEAELFESIYSQACAAREPMQESLDDVLNVLADNFYAKVEQVLGPEEE